MSNVVSFRSSRLRPAPETFDADIDEMATRVTGLLSKAREEIAQSILMLDLAAQHARQIAKQIGDPTVKENFDANVTIIEQLLQAARSMALRL